MSDFKYIRPDLPVKEIEYCIDVFDKEEAKKRILNYISLMFDDTEMQFNHLLQLKDIEIELKEALVNSMIVIEKQKKKDS